MHNNHTSTLKELRKNCFISVVMLTVILAGAAIVAHLI
jgi:hypothetical protein